MRLKSMLNRTFTGLLVCALFGCGSAPARVQPSSEVSSSGSAGMDLDAAIREAASQMEARLPARTEVALVSVGSPSAAFSENVINRLEAAIVGSGKLVVVDRAHLDQIRSEQGFQLSGEVDDNSAKEIGRLLGAGAIVTGSLADLGDVYALTLKAINIQTATVAVSYLADLTKTARIETLLAARDGAASGRRPAAAPAAPAAPAPAAPPATPQPVQAQVPREPPAAPAAPAAPVVYKVGDTGPAGGIVFFDMGFYMNGWRYLEAAPRDFQIGVRWGPNGDTGARQTILGSGKGNTELIISKDGRETLGAAQMAVVDAANYTGHDDWFLPSMDELNLMYTNLKARGLGRFGSGWYWSSTEYGGNHARCQNFSNGAQDYYDKANAYSVRAIRQF